MKWSPSGSLPYPRTAGSQFGQAIVLAGDLALVGAPGEANGAGMVYAFRRARDGAWSAAGALPAQGLVAGDHFGSAIAIDGDRVVVGAPSRKVKGAIYVFRRDAAGTWAQETEQTILQIYCRHC